MKDDKSPAADSLAPAGSGPGMTSEKGREGGATVLLGITGSIAAYKALELASRLRQRGYKVIAVMTRAAQELVGPASFEAVTANPVAVELFPKVRHHRMEHISLAEAADLLAVVPATANFLAKAAHGLGDDLLTTVALACPAPKLAAPAMNVNMWQSQVVQDNLAHLRQLGWTVVEPEVGHLACGAKGAGRLANLEKIEGAIIGLLNPGPALRNIPILITAGRTEEPLDPIRYLTNRSSGRMGFALAKVAGNCGAKVTLITGASDLEPPQVHKLIRVSRAEDMCRAVLGELDRNRVLIMAAAVADYTPATFSPQKIKKRGAGLTLRLRPTPDILSQAWQRSRGKVLLVGFALETSGLLANAIKKLKEKRLDLIVANDVRALGNRQNQGWLIDSAGRRQRLPWQDKEAMARVILERVAQRLGI